MPAQGLDFFHEFLDLRFLALDVRLHEHAGDEAGERAEEAHAGRHQHGGDRPARIGHRETIPVADGGHGHDRPPDRIGRRLNVGGREVFLDIEDQDRAGHRQQAGNGRHGGEGVLAAVAEQVLGEHLHRAEGPQKAHHPEDPEQAPGAERIQHRDARNEIDPPPLEEGPFGRGLIEPDEEIRHEDQADEEIEVIDHLVHLRRQVEQRLHEQRDQHVNRQDDEKELEDRELFRLLGCWWVSAHGVVSRGIAGCMPMHNEAAERIC